MAAEIISVRAADGTSLAVGSYLGSQGWSRDIGRAWDR
jgi:hypothetical protein